MSKIYTNKENEKIIRAIFSDYLWELDADYDIRMIHELADYCATSAENLRGCVLPIKQTDMERYTYPDDPTDVVASLTEEGFFIFVDLSKKGKTGYRLHPTAKVFHFVASLEPPITQSVDPISASARNNKKLGTQDFWKNVKEEKEKRKDLIEKEIFDEPVIEPDLYDFIQHGRTSAPYRWTHKLQQFYKLLWIYRSDTPELREELAMLAFKTADCIAQTMLRTPADDYSSYVVNEEDARRREKYYCQRLFNLAAFIATDSIPATVEEKKRLLGALDCAAKTAFRDDITREKREITPARRAPGCQGKKVTVEELESLHTISLPGGQEIELNLRHDWEWLNLKPLIRESDELWNYCTDMDSWDHLAGEAGIALVRDGEVIYEITIVMS